MNTPSNTPSRGLFNYLIFTAVFSGGLVMVLEVLGSRVLGPFFGVSLFVWTSLITVTLISLAAGYGIGGWFADRRGTPDVLYAIILLAGIATLLIVPVKGTVLKLCFPLGLRMGALVSALLLFGPALFLLGCVSPYIVKIAAGEIRTLGRTVGGFYALSTLGSVLGTVLTGFVLIAYLGVNRIFEVVGVVLILIALGYFLLFRKRWLASLTLLVPILLVSHSEQANVSRILEDGTRVTTVVTTDSYYGSIKVLDYTFETKHMRELIIDGLIQGGIDLKNQLSIYEYPYLLQFLPYGLHPDGNSCLVIGLGAGVIPRWYESQGIRTDVVDIDPKVIEIAKEYFGFQIEGNIEVADARYYLAKTKRHYDYVILDVFSGDTTPGYLLSREAITLLSQRLEPGGVLGINMVGSLHHENRMTVSIVRTLGSVFDQVEVYPAFDIHEGKGFGNLAIMAYMGKARSLDATLVDRFPVHPLAESARRYLTQRFEFPADTPAMILTDDYNPTDFFDAWVKESVRREILETTHWDLLIESS